MANLENSARQSLWAGLVVRRECWRLSWRGRLLALLVFTVFFATIFFGIHAFLAVSRPLDAELLVVEGWMPAYALDQARMLHTNGHYRRVLVCGAVVPGEWATNSATTFADWGASKLRRLGMPADQIETIRAGDVHNDRTYATAVAVRDWLKTNSGPVKAVNVVSLGPHSRRSRLLFQRALGEEVKVGIISVPDRLYRCDRWWQTSEGVREVIGETIAYVYARFFFSPVQ